MNTIIKSKKFFSKNILKHLYRCKSYHNEEHLPEKLRNIGILAHIDAGKTTTTERMLYYSGTIGSMGEVHHGNTVTDFMEQERQRGITITSAAVSFPWDDYQFNLIDTPGHIDFTMEVEQSLSVLDGAVVILDGSAGVEAQTLTVWRQCDNYNLPRIVYINKMDRQDGDVKMCYESLRNKLEVIPLPLQIPIKNESKEKLKGLVDIVKLESIMFTDGRGKRYVRKKLTENEDGFLWEEAMIERSNVVDTLSEFDDELANLIIQSESLDDVDEAVLKKSIRNSTLNTKIVPVLCGSSYKNVGVQMLMDSIIDFLPSPTERNHIYNCFKNELCARAFKVQHDDQKGVLTYFRIYTGKLMRNQKIYNITKSKVEQGPQLYLPYADEYQNVPEIKYGNVAVISGLKFTMTGDMITSSVNASVSALKELSSSLMNPETLKLLPLSVRNKIEPIETPEDRASSLLGMGTTVPYPVFYCSIEPPSISYQSALENALEELQREDASLRVTNNTDTGQTILAGMGELHLDIIRDRILKEYKIEADLGPLQIAYKETILNEHKETHHLETKIAGSKHSVKITLSAYPTDKVLKNYLKLDTSQDSASNLAHIHPKHMQAIKHGIESALVSGPRMGCPVINVGITLHWLEVGYGTAETMVAAAVTQCLRKIFNAAECILLEPIMYIEVVCPDSYSSKVLSDIGKRRATILQFDVRGKNKIIECLVPLSELLGYSKELRSMASGTATFTMEFHSNQPMSAVNEEKAIKSLRGF